MPVRKPEKTGRKQNPRHLQKILPGCPQSRSSKTPMTLSDHRFYKERPTRTPGSHSRPQAQIGRPAEHPAVHRGAIRNEHDRSHSPDPAQRSTPFPSNRFLKTDRSGPPRHQAPETTRRARKCPSERPASYPLFGNGYDREKSWESSASVRNRTNTETYTRRRKPSMDNGAF